MVQLFIYMIGFFVVINLMINLNICKINFYLYNYILEKNFDV